MAVFKNLGMAIYTRNLSVRYLHKGCKTSRSRLTHAIKMPKSPLACLNHHLLRRQELPAEARSCLLSEVLRASRKRSDAEVYKLQGAMGDSQ